MKKVLPILFPLILFQNLCAQQDSACHLRISLLTCTPGKELYSTFGHSALRVVDSARPLDIIFNYGTFDFGDPAFYSKFVRGKLLYFVSVDEFENFVAAYQYEGRGITEQVLNLSCSEAQQLFAALQENAKEENKYYKYDFVSDNCTTRLRDIVFKNAGPAVATREIRPQARVSFRNLIHEYLNKSHQYWSKLGIDILLGIPLDKNISNSEAMFLPDYLLKAFDSTKTGNQPLISQKAEILKAEMQPGKPSLLSPFAIFLFVFLFVTFLSLTGRAKAFLSIFDFVLFFVSGSLGLLMLFMWFGTDHPECKNNLNVIWALPLHFIAVFFIYRRVEWLRIYFLVNAVLLFLLLISWKWLPQEMNNALLPLIALLLLRTFIRFNNLRYAD